MDVPAGVVFGLIALLGWSLGNIAATKAVRGGSTLQAAMLGQVIGFILLCAAALLYGKWETIETHFLVILILIGGMSVPLYWLLYQSFAKGKLAVVVPISSSFAVPTVLVSILFFGERLAAQQTVAIIAIVIGTVLLAIQWKAKLHRADFLTPGAGYALIVAILWAIQFSLIGYVVSSVHWLQATLIAQGVSAAGLTLWFMLSNEQFSRARPMVVFSSLAGILETIAFLAFNIGSSVDLTSIVAPIASATVLVTVPVAMLTLRERPNVWQWIGGALTVTGVIVLSL